MSAPRCATCRFAAAHREVNDGSRWQTADYVGFVTCVRIVHSQAEPPQPGEAAVLDGSGYAARLVVLPTFGCVLHEPKEPA